MWVISKHSSNEYTEEGTSHSHSSATLCRHHFGRLPAGLPRGRAAASSRLLHGRGRGGGGTSGLHGYGGCALGVPVVTSMTPSQLTASKDGHFSRALDTHSASGCLEGVPMVASAHVAFGHSCFQTAFLKRNVSSLWFQSVLPKASVAKTSGTFSHPPRPMPVKRSQNQSLKSPTNCKPQCAVIRFNRQNYLVKQL